MSSSGAHIKDDSIDTTHGCILYIEDVTVSFDGFKAINNLSFQIGEPELRAIIGPNGAGKTTFFNAISGLVAPSEGDIEFEGDSIVGLDPSTVTSLGIARTFQNVRLFPNMTVLENVMVAQHCRTRELIYGALLQTKAFKKEEREIRERAEEVLGFFGHRLVGYRLDQPAFALSYANRRRLEIARAMATQPRLLLLDEPVAGMNPIETAELTALIGRLRSEWGFTIVMIEHDMKVVRDVSDRVVVLDHGVPIAQGSYEEVSKDPNVIEAYLGRPVEAKA